MAVELAKAINSDVYDLIVSTLPTATWWAIPGVLSVAVKAVETLDQCVDQVVSAMLARGGYVILTADHGNAEQMVDYETGEPHPPTR